YFLINNKQIILTFKVPHAEPGSRVRKQSIRDKLFPQPVTSNSRRSNEEVLSAGLRSSDELNPEKQQSIRQSTNLSPIEPIFLNTQPNESYLNIQRQSFESNSSQIQKSNSFLTSFVIGVSNTAQNCQSAIFETLTFCTNEVVACLTCGNPHGLDCCTEGIVSAIDSLVSAWDFISSNGRNGYESIPGNEESEYPTQSKRFLQYESQMTREKSLVVNNFDHYDPSHYQRQMQLTPLSPPSSPEISKPKSKSEVNVWNFGPLISITAGPSNSVNSSNQTAKSCSYCLGFPLPPGASKTHPHDMQSTQNSNQQSPTPPLTSSLPTPRISTDIQTPKNSSLISSIIDKPLSKSKTPTTYNVPSNWNSDIESTPIQDVPNLSGLLPSEDIQLPNKGNFIAAMQGYQPSGPSKSDDYTLGYTTYTSTSLDTIMASQPNPISSSDQLLKPEEFTAAVKNLPVTSDLRSIRRMSTTFKLSKPATPPVNTSAATNYVGHYVVLVGYDSAEDQFLYRDPGTDAEVCVIKALDLEKARCAGGTDHDCIVVRVPNRN
ncbi:hypothetical protein HK096_009801, partial [Nowakowskiella sp. JEL0078]